MNTPQTIIISFTRTFWLVWVSLLVCCTPAHRLDAQPFIDQRCDRWPGEGFRIASQWYNDPPVIVVGQEFVPSCDTVAFVDLWLKCTGGTNPTTFRISVLEDSIDSGRQVGQAALMVLSRDSAPPQRFHFSPPLSVTPGRTNVIRVDILDNDNGEEEWSIIVESGFWKYAKGKMVGLPNPSDFSGDLWFREGPEAPSPARSIYWQHQNGTLARWNLNNVTFLDSRFLNDGKAMPSKWNFAAASDFDGDGQDDFLWQHTNGHLQVSFMNDTNKVGSTLLNTVPMKPTNWKVVGMSDFDGDSKRDILWRNVSGKLKLWLMDGTNFLGSTLLNTPELSRTDGKIVGVGDFNRDSNPDILWYTTAGALGVWFMDKTNYVSSEYCSPWPKPESGWRVSAIADFDADEDPDLLLANQDGRQTVWLMSHTRRDQSILLRQGRKVNPRWRVIGAR